ncbi:sigma-54-dependent transcriptional regulator [Pseudobdellovibrio exovorus]|uniref:Response regulator of hydrogenase 3 activity (Sensor HydH) n=1 Tax=Pseudobdellovibrio exovorus JSS TaxID=1184267 RepID=M4VEB7_9BACT|nr:sigma-54 dependent transcriptional regulator [Pseudobdellovibrio exovorus]AGH96381.1 response regulator of hydrogenase 3 activity (sensor HydH) [Pseudobdellovibrio exovorus JSS]
MKPTRVLILDDESTLRTALFRLLDRKGYQVVTAQRLDEARSFMSPEKPFDIAIIDMNLPDGNGLDFLTEIKRVSPATQVIVLTGFASIDSAVQATQKGAYHFLTKPFNVEELMSLLDKALTQKNLEQENKQLRTELGSRYQFNQIIGESEGIKHCLSLVERVADSDSTVLIMGESGTGKELIARAIHYNSNRAKGPFIAINCGAIPSELLESELFGHVKGAFTGAISNRIGRFEMADEGTLFLDEIGDLDPSMQVKILRALQERIFEPVGSTKSVQVNVRVITATNVDLDKAVKDGRFREDLYYRLNVIPIQIPALRERRTDIPLLLNHFMTQFNRNKSKTLTGFSHDAMKCLVGYSWPGNIRELENLIERLSILKGSGSIDVNDLPAKYRSAVANFAETGAVEIPENGLDFNSAVDQFENALILKALEKTSWNKNQAAQLLRLNRTTLVEKMKKKGLKSSLPEAEL